MFEHMSSLDVVNTNPTEHAVDLNAWIDCWPSLRSEVKALVVEYAQSNPTFDQHSVDWLLEELEGSLRMLRHRVVWLQEHIDNFTDTD